ncbi:MAG: right-handed parallel beta-helix repeat-containing protein [Candidatus Buchananbacteria bacterium]
MKKGGFFYLTKVVSTVVFFVAIIFLPLKVWGAPSWCQTCTAWPSIPWMSPAGQIGNATLTKALSPYYVENAATILSYGTVTIEPGVVIKFGPRFQGTWYTWPTELIIKGSLQAVGTTAEPIVFTSYRDDSAGGDTDGDFGLIMPTPGDWKGLSFADSATSTLNSIQIRYAGANAPGPGLAAIDGFFKGSLTNSQITNNRTDGILLRWGGDSNKLVIDNNVFKNNSNGINFQVSNPIELTNNQFLENRETGLMIDFANRTATIKNNLFQGNANFGLKVSQAVASSTIEATNNDWGSPSGPYQSVLNATGKGDKVSDNVLFDPWLNKDQGPEISLDQPVILIPGILGSWPVKGEWRLDPIFGTYDNLYQALKEAGYQEGKTLFSFPYQWRQGNVLTAELLKQKIATVKQLCNCQKVDLVAHSMGGLIAREYIESDNYADDVDQIIFLGTPHQGATKSYLIWEGGEFGPDKLSKLFKYIFKIEAVKNGYLNLSQYVRNMIPTVGQLLPVYDYLREQETLNLKKYPTSPYNSFLELLNQTTKVQKLLTNTKINNIVGDLGNSSTYDIIKIVNSTYNNLWLDGYPENFYEGGSNVGLEMGNGDGTVPLRSSTVIGGQEINSIKLTAEHSDLNTVAQQQIIKILTNQETSNYIDHGKIFNALFVTVHSPVNLLITAPNGQKVGYDLINNTTTQEISQSFYDPDLEFIIIPNPQAGQYQIQTQGTGAGKYELETTYLTDNAEFTKTFVATTTADTIHNFALTYSATSTEPLVQLQPEDTTPPQIQINWPLAQNYLNTGTFTLSFVATDAFSGLASTTATLDGKLVTNQQALDLSLLTVGDHNFKVVAVDLAGNIATQEVNFKLYTNIVTFLKNIEYYHHLGLLKPKGFFLSFMVELKHSKNHKGFWNKIKNFRNQHMDAWVYDLIYSQIKYLSR